MKGFASHALLERLGVRSLGSPCDSLGKDDAALGLG